MTEWYRVTLQAFGRASQPVCYTAVEARSPEHARKRCATRGTVESCEPITREGWLYVSQSFPLAARKVEP